MLPLFSALRHALPRARRAAATPYISCWSSPNRLAHQGVYLFGLRAECEKILALHGGPAGHSACLGAYGTLNAARLNAVVRSRSRRRRYRATAGAAIACHAADPLPRFDADGRLRFGPDQTGPVKRLVTAHRIRLVTSFVVVVLGIVWVDPLAQTNPGSASGRLDANAPDGSCLASESCRAQRPFGSIR